MAQASNPKYRRKFRIFVFGILLCTLPAQSGACEATDFLETPLSGQTGDRAIDSVLMAYPGSMVFGEVLSAVEKFA